VPGSLRSHFLSFYLEREPGKSLIDNSKIRALRCTVVALIGGLISTDKTSKDQINKNNKSSFDRSSVGTKRAKKKALPEKVH